MTRPAAWWDDATIFFARLADSEGSISKLSRATGVPRTTLNSAKAKHDLVRPVDTADEVEVTVEDYADLDAMIRERGLVPDDWFVRDVIVNTWTAADGSLARQLKAFLRRKVTVAMLQPATVVPLQLKRPNVARPQRSSKLCFIYGDDQRPNVEPTFEQHKLEWVAAHQPDVIVDLGDGMDFPTVSGHKTNPAMNWSVQECANNYATWLYRLRTAAPNAEIVVLADNHVTGRFRDYQLAQARALYGITPAEIDGLMPDLEPLLSIRRLLRLDDLNITYLDPPGDTHYAESHHEIVPGELVAIHGYRTGSNLGKKFVGDYGCSVVYGHAHGQDVYATDSKRRGVGQRKRLYGLGVGCGMNPAGGGGFAPGADWQTCALTVNVFPDGGWTFDYMNYEQGVTRWRDEQYGLQHAA